jgi:hypothetical protein
VTYFQVPSHYSPEHTEQNYDNQWQGQPVNHLGYTPKVRCIIGVT